MIIATSIEFFKNLAQYDYNDEYYDLHNDYDCERIFLEEYILSLIFKNNTKNTLVYLTFSNIEITMINFFNFKETENLTIDNIYRGRAEIKGELVETSPNGKAYFYIDFYEGCTLEFWAENVELISVKSISD